MMSSIPDKERAAWNQERIRELRLDLVVCARPTSVLLLSGYWPISGNTVVLATAESTQLLIPSHEAPLVKQMATGDVHPYEIGSLKSLPTAAEAIEPALRALLRKFNVKGVRIGYEAGPWVQPASYAALSSFGEALSDLLRACAPQAALVRVDEMLEQLRLIKTAAEIEKIRLSCEVTARAFDTAQRAITVGKTEMQIASLVTAELLAGAAPHDRCGGMAFCMSGPDAAEAYKFFQITHDRKLQAGDMALVHCNSNVNGYWTDVTRTFHLGDPGPDARKMYDAVFEAERAALAAIRPGARCADVDRAARGIMESRGFAKEFRNPLGHGVGFAAMDHNARPRLHPASPDILRQGMVCNVEPAIYIQGVTGMRQCNVVVCGADGPLVLTHFLRHAANLQIK